MINGTLRTEATAKRLLLVLRLHWGLVLKALTIIASVILLAALLLATGLLATVVLSFALLVTFFQLTRLAVLLLLELLCLHLVEARVVPLVLRVGLGGATHGVVAAPPAWLIMVVAFAVSIPVGTIAPSLVARALLLPSFARRILVAPRLRVGLLILLRVSLLLLLLRILRVVIVPGFHV